MKNSNLNINKLVILPQQLSTEITKTVINMKVKKTKKNKNK